MHKEKVSIFQFFTSDPETRIGKGTNSTIQILFFPSCLMPPFTDILGFLSKFHVYKLKVWQVSLKTGTKNHQAGWIRILVAVTGKELVAKIQELSQCMKISGRLSPEIESISELEILDLSFNRGLTGTIPDEIGNLKNLDTLILAGCSLFGPIPASIGSLQNLTFLALNWNQFSGGIPRTLGNLSKIEWLDLSDNQLEGAIPVSNDQGLLGLDLLHTARHFHFGNNRLSGRIPAKLFNANMKLLHVLLDNNRLTDSIPASLGLVNTLEAVRFDRNQLFGPVPPSITNLRNLTELYLSDNNLNGFLPDLSGLRLTYLDVSTNNFTSSGIPPWASTLQFITTLNLGNITLKDEIPVSLFSLPNLETVSLRDNKLTGDLDIGNSFSNRLQSIDVENNGIDGFNQGNSQIRAAVLLRGNPICIQKEDREKIYCQERQSNISYSTPPNNCSPLLCISNQLSSPNCKCAYPYTGTLNSRVLSFSNFGNTSYYVAIEQSLIIFVRSQNLPVDSVSVSNPVKNSSTEYFYVTISFFPSQQDRFNRTGVSSIAFALANQIYKAPAFFSPYFFIGDDYQYNAGEPSKKTSHAGVIAGAGVGVFVFLVIAVLAGIYAYRQKKQAQTAMDMNPFINWELNKNVGAAPQLKGARWFSLEELKKYTNNFSDANAVGSGGYGKVYQGVLTTGELVAIKRAGQGSMQGALEFKTEIELLSRVHHKNLVNLVGFCFEKGEQMLVYEYIANGTLMDSLSGKSGIKLNCMKRIKVALGAAQGLAYLHELADPPIIHRDIKSSNILLDDHLNPKVSDFGLSKLLVDSERGHVTTQVKGTMGYLDPEYYMTQQLTEKSDVYSFGVLLLELITGRKPIEQGKYIVREVVREMDKSKDLYNLQEILDPCITEVTNPKGLEKFVDLALSCVKEYAAERPSMAEIVKEIENIMELAGLNPTSESATTTETFEDASLRHPYGNEDFKYSGVFPSAKVEPQ
ncbi:hypothetical protein L6164_036759 [Bauhinia variegata]|uniref:Uncharacterized protein n=1 Tax=Bauhinia variegata TaxID=167791 RepID=A0ACB9KI65_BAUVA|nr:hypothetical protein L6164_036759 [Bauhinia variegata]